MMFFDKFNNKKFANKEEANAWLKERKLAGKFTQIHNSDDVKVGWVNSKFGKTDMYIVNDYGYINQVVKVVVDKFVTPEEHDNNKEYDRGVFTATKYIIKNFGEIDKYREIKVRYENGRMAGEEIVYLKNGMTISICVDYRISDIDGTYKDNVDTLLTNEADGKVDQVIKYSKNGKFMRIASGEVIEKRGHYNLHKMNPAIINTSILM